MDTITTISGAAEKLTGAPSDHDHIIRLARHAHYVLLGESTHGTREFYEARAEICERLWLDGLLDGIAIEADWPDAFRVSRYVRGLGVDRNAKEALGGFERFPTWMWRNEEFAGFLERLRKHNAALPTDQRIGVHGLDLYSLFGSIRALVEYLEGVDVELAELAKRSYSCFEKFDEDPQSYGFSASLGLANCKEAAIDLLVGLRRKMAADLPDQPGDPDLRFSAKQNAQVIRNAERYYRGMFDPSANTWNLRDTHMFDTLESIAKHISSVRRHRARIAVWAHNSHIGNAIATEMGRREINLGHLVKTRYGRDSLLVGFSTHAGRVLAASQWDGTAWRKQVNESLNGSYERLFHETGIEAFFLPIATRPDVLDALSQRRLERAIGVIYRPETERGSHYFMADMAAQFDALYHFDITAAVEPLEIRPLAEGEWETYPTGI